MDKPEHSGGAQGGKSHIFPKQTGDAARMGGSFFRAGVIGLHPVSGLVVGGVGGYFLWKRFDAAWCFWGLLFIGFIAGCLNAYRDVRAMLREGEAEDAAKKPPRR